ncbi:hypothetical protein [Thermovenabulum gondwanense]|uniref:hypothetical protein n=1 Tax=Thermovenabulum gondwanense TaxID=520767 RepID=UPI001FE22926|nr:hypothetical protein [Thermovenabulum gondwanense]
MKTLQRRRKKGNLRPKALLTLPYPPAWNSSIPPTATLMLPCRLMAIRKLGPYPQGGAGLSGTG